MQRISKKNRSPTTWNLTAYWLRRPSKILYMMRSQIEGTTLIFNNCTQMRTGCLSCPRKRRLTDLDRTNPYPQVLPTSQKKKETKQKQNKTKHKRKEKKKKKKPFFARVLLNNKKKEFRWILLIPVSYLGLASRADVLRVSSKFLRHDQTIITGEISFWL